jgi:hypothetical protein
MQELVAARIQKAAPSLVREAGNQGQQTAVWHPNIFTALLRDGHPLDTRTQSGGDIRLVLRVRYSSHPQAGAHQNTVAARI